MNINYLTIFLTVAETGSISKTAKQLYTSHQNVSRIIRQLEQNLHVTLFNRHNRGVSLTQEGKIFVPFARNIEKEIDIYLKTILNLQSQQLSLNGEINILTTEYINLSFLSPLFRYFTEFHPNVQLSITTTNISKIFHYISGDSSQIGIIPILNNAKFNAHNPYFPKNISKHLLYNDTYFCLTHRTSPLANKKKICLSDFTKVPILFQNISNNNDRPLIALLNQFPNLQLVGSCSNATIFLQTLCNPHYASIISSADYKSLVAQAAFEDTFVPIPFEEDLSFGIYLIHALEPTFNKLTYSIIHYLKIINKI